MKQIQPLINTIMKAVALGFAAAALVMGYVGIGDLNAKVSLLGLSVFALAVVMLQKETE